jgi:ABC-type uncharacterized transport system auxiliary subunit
MSDSRGPRIAGAVLALSLSCVLVGCLGAAPRDRFYRIEQTRSATELAEPVLRGTLEVERLRSDSLTRERSILHVESADSVQVTPYAYDLWIDSPTQMLQRDLAYYLRGAGIAERVVLPEMNIQENYEIDGWIERLVHVTGDDSVVVELEFSLREARGGEQLLRRHYRAQVAAEDSSMEAVVRAFDSGVGQIFEQLAGEIATLGH